jgi:hypothetical protein
MARHPGLDELSDRFGGPCWRDMGLERLQAGTHFVQLLLA